MKLSELAKEPQLIKITITEPKIVEKYGDEIEFHIYDRQPLDVFTKLANADKDADGVTTLVSNMILNEEGQPIVKDGQVLPLDVLTESVKLITDSLGK